MNITTNQNPVGNVHHQVHPGCIVCSCANSRGLHLKFDTDQDGNISALFECDEAFEGYPGVLHGGVISTVLDGAMGHCMFARGQTAVTIEITTRFRHPVATGKQATVSARITRISHPLYLLEAKIVQDGKIKATAKGKFYDQPDLADVLRPFS